MICASWKELGKPKVYSVSVLDPGNGGKKTDRGIAKKLHEVLSSADAVIAHNGDQFDIKWVNARLVFHGLPPLAPFIQIDTKKLAKLRFRFNSNRLDYLGRYLGVGRKIKTDYELWLDCLTAKGEKYKKAVRKMVAYNKQDVLLLERVYMKLRPFVPAAVNRAIWKQLDRTCPSCGTENALISRGTSISRTKQYDRFQCKSCGSWHQRKS